MRINYVDAFRGFSLLVMVFIQIFDALSVTSIYTDAPFFIQAIKTVTPWPPSVLFSFVSGMSVYLMVNNKLKKNTKSETAKHALKTYGKYILISLPFTIFMWDLSTFFQWNEAIQGIGLSAIIVALILIYLKPKNYELLLSILLITLARHYISQINSVLPYNPPLDQPLIILGSIFINALYRGWFSVLNLVPLFFSGILFFKATRKGFNKKLLIGSLAILTLSLILNFTILPIDYYAKSINLTLYGIGICCVTNSLILLLNEKKSRVSKALAVIGIAPLFIYIGHNLLLLKWVYLFWHDSLPELTALVLTFPLTYIFYYLAKKRNSYNEIKVSKNLNDKTLS